MKRSWMPSMPECSNESSASSSKATVTTSVGQKPKRSKTSKACDSCRKNKTRCEQPSERGIERCHRCNILRLTCSFEGTNAFTDSPAAVQVSTTPPLVPASGSSLPPPRDKTPEEPPIFTPNPDEITAEELVVGPNLLKGEAAAGPGYFAQSPMGAIWDIMRKKPTGTPPAPPHMVDASSSAPSAEQTRHLVDLFETHYLPWLDIPSLRRDPDATLHTSNFLVLACCAVACRHLPRSETERVLPYLQSMAEHAILLRTFDPVSYASLESVQGLLILASWTPAIGVTHAQIHDSSLIATGAVRMALALKLDNCSAKAVALRKQAKEQHFLSSDEKASYEELMWKTRLWTSACNIESMLTIGTNRKPTSIRSPTDNEALDWRVFPAGGTVADYRDFRLAISAQVLHTTAQGLSKPFKNLDQFSKEINELIKEFNYVRNNVSPLRFAYSVERMHMDYLHFRQQAGRLLVLFHALAQIRAWMGAHMTPRPWMCDLVEAGVDFVLQWGVQIVDAAQSLLGHFFEMKERYYDLHPDNSDMKPFSSAPDALYASVLFASSILMVSRYTMFQQFGDSNPIYVHAPAQILSRLRPALMDLAIGPEHAPRRAAGVVHELQRVWHDKVVSASNQRSTAPVTVMSSADRDTSENSISREGSSASYTVETELSTYSNGSITLPVSAERTSTSVVTTPSQLSTPSPHVSTQHDQPRDRPSIPGLSLGAGNDPLFSGTFGDHAYSSFGGNSGYDEPQDMLDPSFFFAQMDPSNFLDNGFWDLFGNNIPADAPAPGFGNLHPESSSMSFPQQR